MSKLAEALINEAQILSERCDSLKFSSRVSVIYNTFDYALNGYAAYVRKYGTHKKQALFLGMNPGPWGMAQTGVPFGEIPAVRDWMGLRADICRPDPEHPKRPVEGFSCKRSEVSGRRLWGLFAEQFPSAEAFFEKYFVLNYCPLAFMVESGANLTPDKLTAEERQRLEQLCDDHLCTIISILEPKLAIGVGGFATKCLQRLNIAGLRIGTILHPSPASPIANREWPQRPIAQLRELGLLK